MKSYLALAWLVATALAVPSSTEGLSSQDQCTTQREEPTDHDEASLPGLMLHGGHLTFGDKAWRYHDLGNGVFVAVEPEKWHETELHLIGSGTSYASAQHQQDVSTQDSHPAALFRRDDIEAYCAPELICSAVSLEGLYNAVATGVSAIVWAAEKIGQGVLTMSKNPTFANFVGVGGQNFVVSLWTESKASPSAPAGTEVNMTTCSATLSEKDLLNALVARACTDPLTGTFSMNLTYPDGSSVTVHMAAAPGSSINGSNVCQAPNIV